MHFLKVYSHLEMLLNGSTFPARGLMRTVVRGMTRTNVLPTYVIPT